MSMKIKTPCCPTCGEPPRGTVETIQGIAELLPLTWGQQPADGGGFEYAGETDVVWDTQEPVTDEHERVLLVCSNHHDWYSFIEEYDPPAPSERTIDQIDSFIDYWAKIRDNNKLIATWSLHEHDWKAEDEIPEAWQNRAILYNNQRVMPDGNTVFHLYRAADAAIRLSGDYHHVFIEAFDTADDGNLYLITGS